MSIATRQATGAALLALLLSSQLAACAAANPSKMVVSVGGVAASVAERVAAAPAPAPLPHRRTLLLTHMHGGPISVRFRSFPAHRCHH